MRDLGDLQRAPGAPPPERPAALPIAVERMRTFDTPEFAGMTFLEVESKTALNKVKGMPFGWSINPYRGCSHACSYCLGGDTPILMADGWTVPLAELRPGDAIYGTQRWGMGRRCVVTRVLDLWSTIKPAFRVRMADGTTLVASADHRFLSRRGWTHVAGSPQAGRRCLAMGDELIGIGRPASAAMEGRESGRASRGGTMAEPVTTRAPIAEPPGLTSGAARRVVSVEPLGFALELYDITTGTGDFIANGVVSHNCFARPTHRYLNLSPLGDFERTIVVKTNVAEVLRRELAKPSWHGQPVAMGTNTDPYQRCEGRYRLMPGIISALGEARTPFSILTKGTLITRDLDVLTAAAGQVPVTAAFTVGMLDEDLWRSSEPGTPSPSARLAAVRRLNDAGIPTGVMVAPIMPGLNDDRDQLAALVDAAAAAGATHISPIVLHLRPGVRELFWPWLSEHHPDLVDRYAALYTKATALKSYREPVERFVAEQRRAAWARHGRPPPAPEWRSPATSAPTGGDQTGGGAQQLRLL